MKLLKGRVYMGRVSCDKDYFTIDVTDNTSHCEAISIHIPLELMGDFLSTRSTECEFEFNGSGNIGKKIEHKQVEIILPDFPYKRSEAYPIVEPILLPFEKDGWTWDRYTIYDSRHKATRLENGCLKFTAQMVRFV